MSISYTYRKVLFFAAIAFLPVSVCFAQATRTWVSGVGDDANPCSRTAPCKTFAGAISKTATGGVIDVLDPGGFGALTITKPITIEAVGTVAGVLVSGTYGMIINTTGNGDSVVLRGLSFDGAGGTGLDGVNVIAAGSVAVPGNVLIENSTITRFGGNGVNFQPSTAAHLTMRNVAISKVGAAGVFLNGATGTAATLSDVRLTDNGQGILARSGSTTVRDSVISGSTGIGVNAFVSGGASLSLSLDRTTISDCAGAGIRSVGAGTTVRMTQSTVTNNALGLVSGGSANNIVSYGTNQVFGNTTDGSATTTVARQ